MEEIYKDYSNYVFNYLLSLTNNVEISEELMQETFYSAIKNIHKFQNNSSLKTWLYKIAKNKWINYYKKNGYNTIVKQYSITNKNFINELKKYDDIIKNTQDETAIISVENEVLTKYEEVVISGGKN